MRGTRRGLILLGLSFAAALPFACGGSADAPPSAPDASFPDDVVSSEPPDVITPIDPPPDPDGGLPKNPITDENGNAGTDQWRLTSPATNREIEGYASATSAAPGETIKLYASTASPQYTVTIYRLGWYQGKGGRLMQAAVTRNGGLQVTPAPDPDGLVECAWNDPLDVVIPATWTSGMYVALLETTDTKKQSFIPFVVRDDIRKAPYLFQASVTTYQAYNNWGGRSLYDFNSAGGARASRVSFLRPYAMGLNPQAAAGVGAGELLTNLQGAAQTGPTAWEYPMVRFLEREGYDVSYVTNIDVHRNVDLVSKHPVFLSVGHDEYWSSKMRDHVEHARDHGTTSLAFFSGNSAYWQVRFAPSKSGAPDATLVCFKDGALDPLAAGPDAFDTTVRFGTPFLSRGEEGLGGLSFQDFGMNAPLVVHEPTSWVFAGTNLAKGFAMPGLLGYEVDGIREPPLPGVFRVMRSPWTTPSLASGLSDGAVRQLPSGAETFAVGSIQFSWGLDEDRLPGITQPVVASAAAKAIARNVLSRLAAPRPPRNRSPKLFNEGFPAPLDPGRWTPRTISEGPAAYDPLVPVAVSAGRLVITPRANLGGLHHGAVTTARTYPFACGAAKVELVQATNAASTADTTFSVAVDPANWYRFTVEAGTLVFGASEGGALTQTTTTYDPVQHRFLRVRSDCVTGQLLFETSADSTTWATRRSVAATVDLKSAYIELDAGTYQAVATPGQAIFDNVDIEIRGVRDDFATQRDPEVFTPDSVHEGGYDPSVRVFSFGGRLHLRPRPNVAGQHHMGYLTTREIDWTGGIARATILQQPDAGSESSVALAVLEQGGGWARTAVSAGKIFFQIEVAKTVSSSSRTFDPTGDAHVRIRHDATTNEIVWETSANGTLFTEARRVAAPWAVTVMRAEIEAGTYQPEATPGEAIVDDVVFAH